VSGIVIYFTAANLAVMINSAQSLQGARVSVRCPIELNEDNRGPRIAVDGERDDWFRIADAAGPSGCSTVVEPLEARPIDRWNTILRRAA
jgi:hypothetical protein